MKYLFEGRFIFEQKMSKLGVKGVIFFETKLENHYRVATVITGIKTVEIPAMFYYLCFS